MSDQKQSIKSERLEPTYYARIPKMALQDLGPYELALYAHYKQAASDAPNGVCFKSNETLAKETKMSINRLKQARDRLEASGYIFIEHHTVPKGEEAYDYRTVTVTIADVWTINHARQQALKGEQQVANSDRGVSPHDTGVSPHDTGVSPHDTEEESFKKNPIRKEQDLADANAPAAQSPVDGAAEKKPRNPPTRSAIFTTLAREAFKVFDLTTLSKETIILISKQERWLKENSPGATEATLDEFYRWYDRINNKAARPQDVAKFAKHFDAFKQQALASASQPSSAAAAEQARVRKLQMQQAAAEQALISQAALS